MILAVHHPKAYELKKNQGCCIGFTNYATTLSNDRTTVPKLSQFH